MFAFLYFQNILIIVGCPIFGTYPHWESSINLLVYNTTLLAYDIIFQVSDIILHASDIILHGVRYYPTDVQMFSISI